MKFLIASNKFNILSLVRNIGYYSHKNNKSYCRRLSSADFPRFHIYIKKNKDALEFSLHLDQKDVCYENQTAHSGEYEGKILEEERDRIINLLNN